MTESSANCKKLEVSHFVMHKPRKQNGISKCELGLLESKHLGSGSLRKNAIRVSTTMAPMENIHFGNVFNQTQFLMSRMLNEIKSKRQIPLTPNCPCFRVSTSWQALRSYQLILPPPYWTVDLD